MATKFSKILSATGSAVLKRRAESINDDATQSQVELIASIKKAIRKVEKKIFNLEDLSVKSTESLVVGENFDSDSWVEQMFLAQKDLKDLKDNLTIAETTQKEYFTTEVSE